MGVLRTGNIGEAFKTWVDVLSTSSPRTANTETATDTTPEAYLKWGEESEFDYSGDFPSGGFEVKTGDTKRDRYSYSEDGRAFTDYKVTNPNNPSQYVIVRRVQTISFTGPGGAQFTLHLVNDTNGTKEGSGQNPASPDLDKL